MSIYAEGMISMSPSVISFLDYPTIDLETQSYLEHHGIKGQKWGIRRYQNSDGSLTDAGRKRYGVKGSQFKVKFQSPYQKQLAKLKEQEREMALKEEIQSRKNKLAERKENLKDQGKSQKTLQNEREEKAAKWAKKEEKRKEKELKRTQKRDEKEQKKEVKKLEKEEKEAKKKERAEAEEEAAYKRKQDEKLTKAITSKRTTEMTNDELQAFIDRYKLEQEYKKIQNETNKNVYKAITGILKKSGSEALGTVSKKAMTYVLDEALEKLSGGKIKSEANKKKDKDKEKDKEKDDQTRADRMRRNREAGADAQQIEDIIAEMEKWRRRRNL